MVEVEATIEPIFGGRKPSDPSAIARRQCRPHGDPALAVM